MPTKNGHPATPAEIQAEFAKIESLISAASRLVGDGRLSMIESTALDTRHRLFLVRRDDVEHLVLVGPSDSVVVERGIQGAAERAQTSEPV